MYYLSIAIIRKKTNTSNHAEYSYLVQYNHENEYMFFDVKSIGIGVNFDYSKLKRQVIDYFELKKDEGLEVNFMDSKLHKVNKRDPYATAYMYTLWDYQVQSIDHLMSTSKDPKWTYLEWLSENDLKSKKWKDDQQFIFAKNEPLLLPDFPNELRTSLRNIVKARDNGKLVIFAGAGVSVDSFVPMWSELTESLKGDLDNATEISDSLVLAQLYFDARRNKEYQERVQEILHYGKTKYNAIHEKIVDVAPNHIITTNYDEHFEQVFEKKGYRYSVVKKDSDLPYSKSDSLFVKVHGDFSERNIVLTSDDFDNYSKRFPLLAGFINGIFASKLVLFVGYSFNDPNLRLIYESVKNILGEDIQPPYFLTSSKMETRNVLEEKFKFKIVNINSDRSSLAINTYFNQVAGEEDEKKLETLNIKGREVYKFLTVVNQYDLILGSLDSQSMENQLVTSLSRFKELNAIPHQILEKITPFKINGKLSDKMMLKADFDRELDSHLRTPNEALLAYLKGQKSDAGIDFYSYPRDDRSFLQKKLDEVWKLLYMSGVRCIIRKNDTSSEHFKLIPHDLPDDKKCNCNGCRFDRFEFGNLLVDLSNLSNTLICQQDFSDLGLDTAYGYLRTGQVVKAFYALEETKNQALKSNKLITFFMASFNQKYLKFFIWSPFARNTTESELDKIIEQIDSIDVDKLLFELKVDKDVKDALRIIKENKIFEYVKSEVYENHSKIILAFQNFKKKDFYQSGPNYPLILQERLHYLWNFYHKNRLFFIEYSTFRDLVDKYVEGMIVSFCTDSRYKQKITEFYGFFFNMFIYYSDPTLNRKLFHKYQFKFFNVSEDLKNDFLNWFNEYISTGYVESNFFQYTLEKNEIYSNALNTSDIFKSSNLRILNNFLLLASHLQLDDINMNSILEKTTKYLNVSEIFWGGGVLDGVTYFVRHRINDFSDENLKAIINYYLRRGSFYFDSLETILIKILGDKAKPGFLGKETYKRLISEYDNIHKDNDRFILYALYTLFDDAHKEKFFKIIETDLLSKSDLEGFFKTYRYGVWDPNKNPLIFEKFVSELSKEAIGFKMNSRDYTVENAMYFFVQLVYKYNLFTEPYVQSIADIIESNQYKWILNINEFDYTEFNLDWLEYFSSDFYLPVFSKSNKLLENIEELLKNNFHTKAAEVYFSIKS